MDLRLTRITRLPESLRVGGAILPPSGLVDLIEFMRDRPRDTIIAHVGSLHQKMEHCARFPELHRVEMSLGAGRYLTIRHVADKDRGTGPANWSYPPNAPYDVCMTGHDHRIGSWSDAGYVYV